METYTLPHFPSPYSTIHIALFRSVSNAPSIRRRLIDASLMLGPEGDLARAEIDFTFLEARLIVSRDHLLTAIQATLLSSFSPSSPEPQTRSHNLHSELLLSLSPNNNISDSVRRHGLSDGTDALVVVRIGGSGTAEEVFGGMKAVVQGELVGLGELGTGVDWGRVDKIYKLADMNHLPMSQADLLQKKIAAVINTVAIKSVS